MVRVLDSDDVRHLVSMTDAIAAVREAFAAAAVSGELHHALEAALAVRLAGENGAGRDVPRGGW